MANTYWMSPVSGQIADPALHRGLGLGRWLGTALRALQYGRLVSVMDRLPDTYLNQAGLRRSDIPKEARQIVYGKD